MCRPAADTTHKWDKVMIPSGQHWMQLAHHDSLDAQQQVAPTIDFSARVLKWLMHPCKTTSCNELATVPVMVVHACKLAGTATAAELGQMLGAGCQCHLECGLPVPPCTE